MEKIKRDGFNGKLNNRKIVKLHLYNQESHE